MENFRKFSQVETFRTVSGNFPYDVHASFFYLLIFYRNICVSGNFYRIICFYSIIYVSGNFPESFRKFPEIFITGYMDLVHAGIGAMLRRYLRLE
jgi:hypothetical protein